jgi:hypothetical protein
MSKLTLIAAATLAGAALSPLPAAAAYNPLNPDIRTGVVCRPGATADFRSGVLRCSTTRTVELESICSGVTFAGNGDIGLNSRVIKLATAGVDQCVGFNGAHADSVMRPPVPGIDPAPTPGTYTRVVNPNGPDKFTAQQVVYEYPQGRLFVGDARNGVGCASGFEASNTADGRGLACIKPALAVGATCDGGFHVEHVEGPDLCVKAGRDLFGNATRTVGQYTIPEGVGYVGFMGNPADHGWKLQRDAQGRADNWSQRDDQYVFAHAR